MVKLMVRDSETIQEAVRRFRKLVERSGIKKEMRQEDLGLALAERMEEELLRERLFGLECVADLHGRGPCLPVWPWMGLGGLALVP